ncbi:FAD linked oxidase domain protein (plasmid) [Haloterrigena turkmenica DSM 5511]|uniref:FAD linked oxidase domain protein n=1 Tax=Haloterrigena turkmenica (strain ATCC 51198 / DSM 5511 / JCM 9101 / NCIMB 13204 / VKM B-1734 / 4k) TaxID=543526 RepID=D2S273_HALTV|nr:FAD-binding and (Fe-S)-binding domain-containing protein [Haloterrigena turkmenica]ADB63470.1 FAD linked oxidase domain protein [Haloterrigena turkmenica DSM 5511]
MAVEKPQGDLSNYEEFRNTLDHDYSDVGEYAELADDLRSVMKGEVRFDEYAQVLYSTDGSIYQARPAGAVLPRDTEDVRNAIRVAAEHDVPIMARGAGSSLGGQTVGPGCVVLDLSTYMDDILEVDAEEKRARVQPGVVQDHLDDHLAQYGLKFAPDPASSNRATIGGGIGNNSTGAHSVRYGITDAYTEELNVVLADGSLIHTREVVLDSEEYEEIVSRGDREAEIYRTVRALVEENADEIEARYPDLKRTVSGYNLDRVIYENEDGETVINLSKLFVGAESTLGVIVEAELSLVTLPEETALVLYCFDDLIDALEAVPEALEFDPSAVELMDSEVFRLARESEQFSRYEAPIPDGTEAALMLEYDSELHDDFEAAIGRTNAHFVDEGDAFEALEAYTEDEQADLWKLRKAAIPLLMSLEGDPKPYPFIEDATVPPEELAEYVQKFMGILDDHDTSAAYFAHAGSGTLHIRPILNLKEDEGVQAMQSISGDVTDLVVEHHGSFSGEHGDGLARTAFNPKMYGEDLWAAFQEVKSVFDPDWRMNPGKVVYTDENPTDMRENLRYGAGYTSIEPQTKLDFTDEGGFSQLVELCNGCGTCRQTDDVMCPTYRGMKDEIATTRGRANMLRAAISGEIDEEEMYSERFQEEVLDLCVGCKGCKSDCPTGVDLAKLKAETKHQYHEREGIGLRERLFGNIDTVSKLGSALAPLANAGKQLPGSRLVMEKVAGIAPERTLPSFERESLQEWFARRGSRVSPEAAHRKVVLFPDTYTNYNYTRPGKAAVRVLESAGVHVEIPEDVAPSGRAAFSVGMLDAAEDRARTNVDLFAEYIEDGYDVVAVEPSDAVVFQDEYRDLVSTPQAETVAAHAYGISEYIDKYRLLERLPLDETEETLAYHGHCHQKATGKDHHAVGVLRRAGYAVDPIDSTCCGMAGSFGYEAEHYDLSKAIGERLYEKLDESDGMPVAPGASCRSQIGDQETRDERPPHPIEKVNDLLTGS